MNGKKAKERTRKVENLKKYMRECYELEMQEWKAAEPRKMLFISHYLWKKREPIQYSASESHYKKSLKGYKK